MTRGRRARTLRYRWAAGAAVLVVGCSLSPIPDLPVQDDGGFLPGAGGSASAGGAGAGGASAGGAGGTRPDQVGGTASGGAAVGGDAGALSGDAGALSGDAGAKG